MSATKTLLFTTMTSVPTGGVNTREVNLARMLPSRGWRAVFALTWGNRFHRPAEYQRLYPEVETVLMDARSGTHDARMMAVTSAISGVHPDVVIPGAVAETFDVLGRMKARGSNVRLVWGMPGVSDGGIRFIRAYRGIVDQAYAVSRYTAHLLQSGCSIDAARVHYVPTGVADAERLTCVDHEGPIRLGYVGRFDDDKRPLDAIELCRALDAAGVDFRMRLIGRGSLTRELVSRGEFWIEQGRLSVEQAIPLRDLYEHVYPNLDVMLLFSPREGMPNGLLEAMTHGIIPVVGAYEGLEYERLVEDAQTGLVFPVSDMAAAAEGVKMLSRDISVRRRLSTAAHSRVRAGHGLEQMADAFVEVLEQAMSAAPALAAVPALPAPGSARLSALAGSHVAERIRRVMRRRFHHTDDNGEWPRIDAISSLLPVD